MYQSSVLYNEAISRGFICYGHKEYSEAYKNFETALHHDNSKSDPQLYMACCLFPIVLED
jgi:hypothetical protein